jgi:hypothetical protein
LDGIMSKRISPENLAIIDRRQLLGGAAAATAISGLPASEPAVAAPHEIEGTNLAGWSHFSAVTRTRLEEIEFRNRLRKEAGLPLLSVAKELRSSTLHHLLILHDFSGGGLRGLRGFSIRSFLS